MKKKVVLGGRSGRMKLYLVRHGETDWNKVKKIQGQVDIPLNQFGKHLAEETAEGLHDIPFDLCISSPLSRAYDWKAGMFRSSRMPELGKWHSVNMRENAAQEIIGNFRKIFRNFSMIRWDSDREKVANHLRM